MIAPAQDRERMWRERGVKLREVSNSRAATLSYCFCYNEGYKAEARDR
jgi:hypothetical protein